MAYDFFLSGLSERRLHQAINAIEIIEKAKEEDSIRNVVFKEVKDILNRACYESVSKLRPDYDYDVDRSYDLQNFHDEVNLSNLHEVIATNKKVKKMKERDETVEFYDKFSSELLDLALTMKDLSKKVVKGRDPSKEPAKPVNPNKIMRTCGCCLREIAIGKDKTMVHHGFQRPGDGYQTASCPGIQFKPLEMSKAGPEYMVSVISDMIERETKALENLKEATEVTERIFRNENRIIKKGEPRFESVHSYHVSNKEFHISRLNRDLDNFKKIVKEWKQKEDF